MPVVAIVDPRTVLDVLDRLKPDGRVNDLSPGGKPALLFRQSKFLQITLPEGEKLSITDEDVIRSEPESFLPPDFLDTPEGFNETTWEGESVLTYRVELKAREDPFGTLQVVFSLEDLQHTKMMTRTIFIGLIGFFLLLLILLNLLIFRIVINPVRALHRAMRRAGRGELGISLAVHSEDEIGEMSRSFNQMVSNLKILKEEIEDYSHNLERKVEDRTRDLKESEAMLLDLKNYLATVLENVGAGVISLDSSGKITTFNEMAAQLLGIEASEAEGRLLKDVMRVGDLPRLAEMASNAQRSGSEPVRDEMTMRFHGRRIQLAVSATPLQREGESKPGVILVFDDVTQLVYSEKLVAWKEAVEKVIHEIKNPITPIRLSAQQLLAAFSDRSENFDVIFRRGMQNIISALDTLHNLVTDFSQFYRLPKVDLRTEDINDLVRKTLSLYSEGLPEGIQVVSRLDEAVPTIQVDREQIKRVLVNVINNALESMEGKLNDIEVITAYKKQVELVVISVRDRGKGMKSEEMEKIFEPYYTTKIKGTGLGLIITRQIIEERLWTSCSPRKGDRRSETKRAGT